MNRPPSTLTMLLSRHTRRREFIALVAGAAAGPLSARAQQTEPMRRIGALINFAETDPSAKPLLAAFRSALSKLGWTEGGNLRIELRWGAGNPDRIRKFAKELVDLRPDVILGHNTVVISESCSRVRSIRSAAASQQTSRIRAATSPASQTTILQWAANGWRY